MKYKVSFIIETGIKKKDLENDIRYILSRYYNGIGTVIAKKVIEKDEKK